MGWGSRLIEFLGKAWRVMVQVQRDKATSMLEFELKEIQNVFALTLIGSFVGQPSPPAAVTFELLPYLDDELRVMFSRADLAQDPLGSLMGMLEID
jgi:hypothetical protein